MCLVFYVLECENDADEYIMQPFEDGGVVLVLKERGRRTRHQGQHEELQPHNIAKRRNAVARLGTHSLSQAKVLALHS